MNKVVETVRDYWLGFLLAAAGAFVTTQWGRMKRARARKRAMEAGVRELLATQIIDLCHKYSHREKLPLYVRKRIRALLAPYDGLDGDEDIMDVALQLLAKPDDDGRSDELC